MSFVSLGRKIIGICKKYLQPAAVNRDFVLGQLGQALAAVREVLEGGGVVREGGRSASQPTDQQEDQKP